jgi:Xaa-Pro aminopeptidase
MNSLDSSRSEPAAASGPAATPSVAAGPAPIPLDVYRTRRARVYDALRAYGGGVAVVTTAPVTLRNRDADYPYRHDSYFYYLSGFAEPEAWLVLRADAQTSSATLFCRARHEEHELWEGFRYGPERARDVFGFDAAYPLEELDERMPTLLANAHSLHHALGTSALDAKLADTLRGWLGTVRASGHRGMDAPSHICDLSALLDEMRVLKDDHELAIMRRAGAISARAHLRALRACRPGVHEYELEAELLYEFRRTGAQGPAYGSIVAAGANACVLHHPAGNAVIGDGELVLIDAACELEGYASDITRTFPANGRFSGPQRELYEIVLAAQQAAIDATKAGARFDAPHDAAVRVLSQGMLDTRLLDPNRHGSVDDVIGNLGYRRFYMHRTSHWLGMDVHDAGDYRNTDAAPEMSAAAGAARGSARPYRALRPNMTLTIEPGLYVRAADDVPPQYWNIGIRIEDDAIVTPRGCELFTRDVPVRADDIEALVRDRQ